MAVAGEIARPSDMALGELDYNEITAASPAFTSEADISGLTVSFVLATTRIVRIDAQVYAKSTIANDQITAYITDSASNHLADTTPIIIPSNNATVERFWATREVLTAGSYTYKIRAVRTSGSGSCTINAATTNPSWIMAVDLGPG